MKICDDILAFQALNIAENKGIHSFSVKYFCSANYEYSKSLSISLFLDREQGAILEMEFYNVLGLNFGDVNSLLIPIFEIEDISSHQLEGIRFQVEDVASDLFRFSCTGFTLMEH